MPVLLWCRLGGILETRNLDGYTSKETGYLCRFDRHVGTAPDSRVRFPLLVLPRHLPHDTRWEFPTFVHASGQRSGRRGEHLLGKAVPDNAATKETSLAGFRQLFSPVSTAGLAGITAADTVPSKTHPGPRTILPAGSCKQRYWTSAEFGARAARHTRAKMHIVASKPKRPRPGTHKKQGAIRRTSSIVMGSSRTGRRIEKTVCRMVSGNTALTAQWPHVLHPAHREGLWPGSEACCGHGGSTPQQSFPLGRIHEDASETSLSRYRITFGSRGER